MLRRIIDISKIIENGKKWKYTLSFLKSSRFHSQFIGVEGALVNIVSENMFP